MVQYRKEKDNMVIDALSRRPTTQNDALYRYVISSTITNTNKTLMAIIAVLFE